MTNYLVVFEYTAKAGAYAENRYIMPFLNEADYRSHCTDERLESANIRVVDAGISSERAHELCEGVGMLPRVTAVLAEYGGNRELAALALGLELPGGQ